jgi:hypothetical protein
MSKAWYQLHRKEVGAYQKEYRFVHKNDKRKSYVSVYIDLDKVQRAKFKKFLALNGIKAVPLLTEYVLTWISENEKWLAQMSG